MSEALQKKTSQTKRAYYVCFVPMCTNTTIKTPEKKFISVPQDKKRRRQWWLSARPRRKFPMLTNACYGCEDHFDLANDVENYLYIKMMGGKVILKEGVVPHKFECQGRLQPVNENRLAMARKRIIQEILQEKKPTSDGSNVRSRRLAAMHRHWSIENSVLDGTDHPRKVVKIPHADSPIKDIEVVEVKEEQTYTEEAEKIHPFQEHDPLSTKLEPASWQPSSLQEELQPKEKSNQSSVALVFLPVGRWLPSSQSHPAAVATTIQSQSRESQRVNVKEEIDIKEEDIGYFNTEEVAEYVTEKKTSSRNHM